MVMLAAVNERKYLDVDANCRKIKEASGNLYVILLWNNRIYFDRYYCPKKKLSKQSKTCPWKCLCKQPLVTSVNRVQWKLTTNVPYE